MSVQNVPSSVALESVSADEISAVDGAPAAVPVTAERLVESDLLVEDVSIDGMCGVY